MTFAVLANFILTYGPSVIPLAQKLVADVESRGNQTVTSADLAELARLANLTGDGIFATAGVVPPPKTS